MATERAVAKAREAIGEGADLAEKAIGSAARRATRATRRARGLAEDGLEQGSDALEEALVCARDMVRAHPITAMAMVAAVAYLWGRIRS